MTTLVEELEQAADDADILARMVATMGHAAEVIGVIARAHRLRQRAAWVRELEAKVGTGSAGLGGCDSWTFRQLTGPIPSETAPAAPCETCKGAREVLFSYDRGPGSFTGNQMIPCPKCRPAAPKEGSEKP